MEASAPSSRLALTAAAIMVVWALGTLGLEGVAQAGAVAAIIMAVAAHRKIRLAEDLRLFAWLTLAFAAWQALSPLLALATGTTEHLPRAARWTQALDTLAPLALAAIATFGVPWRALAWTLGFGWLVEAAMGLFQFLVRWPFGTLGAFKVPLARLQETFNNPGEPERHAGLGFFFHRLRYAHGAVAALGPAIAAAARLPGPRHRALAGGTAVLLLGCVYMAYARAALGAAVAVAGLGLLLFLKGRQRLWALAALVATAAMVLAFSTIWQLRILHIKDSLVDGERTMAWTTGWHIVRQHPILGSGYGNYEPASLPFRVEGWMSTLWQHSHNALLTVWAEMGLVGLVLYLALHLALARVLWKRARAGSVMAAGALLSWVGFQVLGLVHYPQFHTGVMLSFALAWGLGLAPSERREPA